MEQSDHAPQSARGRSRARLILPIAGAGLILACAAVMMHDSRKVESASQVAQSIREIALAGADPHAPFAAGTIGPWKIGAESVDPATGVLRNFSLTSGQMIISARTATVLIDHETNSFSFDLQDVIYARVPETGDRDEDSFVQTLDHYLLGPVPYGIDIVADDPGDTLTFPLQPPAAPSPVVSAEPADQT